MMHIFLLITTILTLTPSTCVTKAQLFESFDDCELWHPKEVTVKQGTVRGSTLTSGRGKPFCAFQGIPFSEPPVGKLRFQPPQPPKPWTGVLNVTERYPDCIQYPVLIPFNLGQEDCLYLSVFTPRLTPLDGRQLDVIVWIYAGNFVAGSTDIAALGPEYFVDYGIIFVIFNHRLGSFGFLSTGDDEAPGNYGMKDQVAVLQWVRDNIAAFGGNASSVTIGGISSGGASVHYHMFSPLSQDLFQRAISMEGTALNPWARYPDPLRQAQKQARSLGCPTEPTSSLMACLREIDARNLSIAVQDMFQWLVITNSGYTPVIEKKTDRNPRPFITEDPLKALRCGEFKRVPWLVGSTDRGANIFCLPLLTMEVLNRQLNENFDNLISRLLLMNYSFPQEKVANITEEIETFYLGSERRMTESNYLQNVKMFSDRLFIHPVYKTVELHILAGHTDIYRYNFAYRGVISNSQISTFKNYGATHADELVYLFRRPLDKIMTNSDKEVRSFLISSVTNFAKYGNPTPGIVTGNYMVDELEWPPVVDNAGDYTHLRYLNIGQVITSPQQVGYLSFGLGPPKLHVSEDLYKERMEFWNQLPLPENSPIECSNSDLSNNDSS